LPNEASSLADAAHSRLEISMHAQR
jgi:hypothetical protein